MSLQTSYAGSIKDYISGIEAIERSRIGFQGQNAGSSTPDNGLLLSLAHLDVNLAVTTAGLSAGKFVDGCGISSESPRQNDAMSPFSISIKPFGAFNSDVVWCSAAVVIEDPIMRSLSEALEAIEAANGNHSGVCADALRLAIVARHFSRQTAPSAPLPSVSEQSSNRRAKSLQKWRLKRVLEYVDNNLAEKITLQELATIAGLSRMHFAAQFRAATGLRPHQHILKQRIERSKELLKKLRNRSSRLR